MISKFFSMFLFRMLQFNILAVWRILKTQIVSDKIIRNVKVKYWADKYMTIGQIDKFSSSG